MKQLLLSALLAMYFIACSSNDGEGESKDINTAQTVFDNLMLQSTDLSSGASWSSANDMCESSNVGGYDNWRLPTRAELGVVYNNKYVISGLNDASYWSSESVGNYYYYYNMRNGTINYNTNGNSFSVRCVRTITNGSSSTGTYLTIKNSGSIDLDSVVWNGTDFGTIEVGKFSKKSVYAGSGKIYFVISGRDFKASTRDIYIVEQDSSKEENITANTIAEEVDGSLKFINSAPIMQLEKAQAPKTGKLNITEISYASARFNSTTENAGNPRWEERGFCYSREISEIEFNCYKVEGDFIKTIDGLDDNTKYYARAYIDNNKHDRQYSEVESFETIIGISVFGIDNITASSALLKGSVLNSKLEYTEKGFCYSNTNTLPTKGTATAICKLVNETQNYFELELSDLQIANKYYVRAYVETSNGIRYSDIVEFETNIFIDERDGRQYKIKDIGSGIIWFLEDLAYNATNRYTWDEAMVACPSGWRLPTNADWDGLIGVWSANSDYFLTVYSSNSSPTWWSATGSNISSSFSYVAYIYSNNLYNSDSNCYSNNCNSYYKTFPLAVRCVKN